MLIILMFWTKSEIYFLVVHLFNHFYFKSDVSHISGNLIHRMNLFIKWMRITEFFLAISDVRKTSNIRQHMWLFRNRFFICEEQLFGFSLRKESFLLFNFCHYWIGTLHFFWSIMNMFKLTWSLGEFKGNFAWFNWSLHFLFWKHQVV